jgi:hypothetical protein
MTIKMLTALVLSVTVFATLEGQQRAPSSTTASASLTALDYYEIQQVYARFNHALDSAEDNGNAFASVFTPDGVFVTAGGAHHQGHDQLAAFAREDPDKRKGPTNVGHYVTNVAIDATPSGARGHGYLLEATQLPPNPTAGARGRGPGRAITEGGSFWDDLIRTPQGWRIKTRTMVRPNGPMPAAVPESRPSAILAASAMPHPFSAQDYADITQLFALFGYGFDSAADNGYQWANLYTADGVFVNGTVVGTMRGRDTLAAFAAGRLSFPNGFASLTLNQGTPHNPLAIAHILTDVVIDPAPEGAVAKAYRLNATIGADGRPALAPGGVYHVLLARTPEGWRFKENWYVAAGAPVQDGAKRFLPGGGQPAPAAAAAPAAAPVTRDKMQALTINAEDDAAIRQLYARFSHAIDSNAENGAALARLFTADGVFLDTWTNKVYAGSAQLSALALEASVGKGPTSLNHFVWTVKVEAAPQGATAKGYVMTGTLQPPGMPIVMTNGGQYWDDLVKTADGWRFKKRTFFRSSQTPPTTQTASN